MLRDIQSYIAQHGTVSIADLSLHFHTDSQAIKPMLAKLSRKGRIRPLPPPTKCSGCTCCEQDSLECYEWLGTRCHKH
jgi:putative ferrous iron transport protein C